MSKFVKLFKNFKIDLICKKYDIENYTINPDGTVDVDGDVNLRNRRLKELPIKFGKVAGDFYCHDNQLTTLEGSPKKVGGNFWCHYNQLITLEGSLKEVSGGFYCSNNKLTTLEGAPKEVGGGFYCDSNKLKTLEGAPKEVGGSFYINDNPLPKKVLTFKDKKYILKWQNDYGIWQSGKLNQFRWQQMINDYDLG
jgi:hypothetical protein